MIPVIDKPVVQYAVEEARAAGIEEFIFVSAEGKESIPKHFSAQPWLEKNLAAKGKTELLETVRGVLPPGVSCIYIRQPAPLGLGHAVLCAKPVVGDEPFAVLLADDLLDADVSVTKQLVDVAHARGGSVLGVMDVPKEDTRKYGIVTPRRLDDLTSEVMEIVEKPEPAKAPSTMAVVGRYVLEAEIFDRLERTPRGAGGEIQLTDGISDLLASRRVFAHRYEGTRYDCGSKSGFFEATVAFARRHPEIITDA